MIDENGNKVDQNSLADFSSPVRVFNEDFIKSNLKFLIDPAGEIAPFAILGNTNGTLVDEIKELTKEIGRSEEPKTGLHKAVDDANNSFGNSARKFLEMYLYFKYPTDEELLPKLKRFFEPEDVPPILINRLVNEDSHGPTPENSLRAGIDPETIPVAKKILQLLQKDSEQYDAFMESIS